VSIRRFCSPRRAQRDDAACGAREEAARQEAAGASIHLERFNLLSKEISMTENLEPENNSEINGTYSDRAHLTDYGLRTTDYAAPHCINNML
jgi:hypothetical protein